jgi:flagellar protein FliO/FliZ
MRRLSPLLAALLAFAAPAWAAEPANPPGAGSLAQVLVWLLVVCGLLAGVAWLLKRFGIARPPAGNVARIVGGVSVGSRERVLVVEVADQWIVVGVGPGRVNALSTMPKRDSAPTTQPLPDASNFAAWLKQTIEKRNGSK